MFVFFLNKNIFPKFKKRSNLENTQNYLKFNENGSMDFANSSVSILGLTIEMDSFINGKEFFFHFQKKSTFQINVNFFLFPYFYFFIIRTLKFKIAL